MRVEFVLRSDAVELRKVSSDSADDSCGHRVSSVLQHNPIAIHAMSEWSFVVPQMSITLRMLPDMSSALQRREMSFGRTSKLLTCNPLADANNERFFRSTRR